MELTHQATKIKLFDFSSIPMRTFHMTWFAFFLCFFGWFGIAPLMAVVRDDLQLTKEQVGNTMIASVAVTILVRLLIGWLCDRIGPRRSYTWLLVLGSLPVMGIGLADSYESFLLFRLAIGAIGASFVITQYHTSVMFAPNVVGTANATTAGWGNLGGGVTQAVMPMIFAAVLTFVGEAALGWRIAMVFPGLAMLVSSYFYWKLTADSPDQDPAAIEKLRESRAANAKGTFLEACKDARVWALFLIYGACFGIELTLNNIAALYFRDYFQLGLKEAGLVASLFGLMNIFARTLGGVAGDKFGIRWGLRGRVFWLGVVLLAEGLSLVLFSRIAVLPLAIAAMVVFSLFVQMAEGATYSVVPFVNRRALGSVTGIVGAGGNAGAVAAGFLFRQQGLAWPDALLILGIAVAATASCTLLVRFSPADEAAVRKEMEARGAGAAIPVEA